MDYTRVAASPPPDVDRGKGLLAEEITLTSLALITTIVRVGIRLYNRQARWDDLAITVAMVFRLVSFAFTMVSIAAGNGRHQYYLSTKQIETILKWTWANGILLFTTVCLIKIAICLHIFRIKKSGWLKWVLYVNILLLVVTNGSCVIVMFAQCSPISAFWNDGFGSCWNGNIYNDFIYVSVGYSIVSDLLCTAMPIVILWNVRITPRQKVGICGLMFLGLIASACAVVRAYLSSVAEGVDLTYELVTIDEWAFAEANVGIIGANLALGTMMYRFAKCKFGNKVRHRPEPLKPSKPVFGGSWKVWASPYRNGNESSGNSAIMAKDSQHEHGIHSDSNTSMTISPDITRPPSFVEPWPQRFSALPGTITRTIEYTVAGEPYSGTTTPSTMTRPMSTAAPTPWEQQEKRWTRNSRPLSSPRWLG